LASAVLLQAIPVALKQFAASGWFWWTQILESSKNWLGSLLAMALSYDVLPFPALTLPGPCTCATFHRPIR
tara:strand:- start:19900 stop:20112 length:213 start_codon:yes stop_codon:yes gene_type:complete